MTFRQSVLLALAIVALSLTLAIVAAGCRGDGQTEEERVQRAAEDFVAAVNDRDYEALHDLLSAACRERTDLEQLRELWESLGERTGDPGFTLQLVELQVLAIEDGRARVRSVLLLRTNEHLEPFGTYEDPLIEMLLKENGRWRLHEPACEE